MEDTTIKKLNELGFGAKRHAIKDIIIREEAMERLLELIPDSQQPENPTAKEYALELARVVGYIYHHNHPSLKLDEATFMQSVDKVIEIAENFIKVNPVDTDWGVKDQDWDEAVDRFIEPQKFDAMALNGQKYARVSIFGGDDEDLLNCMGIWINTFKTKTRNLGNYEAMDAIMRSFVAVCQATFNVVVKYRLL